MIPQLVRDSDPALDVSRRVDMGRLVDDGVLSADDELTLRSPASAGHAVGVPTHSLGE